MKAIKNNWKAILAALLAIAALLVYALIYRPRYADFVRQREMLANQISTLQTTIAENEKYRGVQELLEPAEEALEQSRSDLYAKFPEELREEDQLLYLLYLEKTLGKGENELGFTTELHDIWGKRFGTDINFQFGQITPLSPLSGGGALAGLNIEVYYHASYKDFKKMVEVLAQDERIASIRYATFETAGQPAPLLDENGKLDGRISLVLYLLDDPDREYEEPTIKPPAIGKPNIFHDPQAPAQPQPQPQNQNPLAGLGGLGGILGLMGMMNGLGG